MNSFCPQKVANVYIFFSKYLILIDMIYLQFLSRYNIYFAGFVFCELLNFLIVVLLIGLTHRFLHFHFVAYGFEVNWHFSNLWHFDNYIVLQVWQYYLLPEEEQRMPGVKNPMCNAFPRIGETQLGNILVLHLVFYSLLWLLEIWGWWATRKY